MSDSDSFIEEVNEEVRRDQLYKYVRKYGWIAVVVILGVVGGTAFLEYQKVQTAKSAQALGDKLVAALQADEAAQRAEALAEVSAKAGPAVVVVEMRRAGELITAGDTEAALAAFDAIANSDADPIYKDMARLKALILRGSSMEAAERDAALAELAKPGAPYRPLALEQQAVAALERDDQAKAIEIFSEVYQDSASNNALRTRAQQMLLALGAEVPKVAELLSQ